MIHSWTNSPPAEVST